MPSRRAYVGAGVTRVALLAAGAVLGGWLLWGSVLRGADGWPTVQWCLFLASAISALIVGASVGTSWSLSGRWIGLAVLGQAAALQLIDAGSGIGYQHLRPGADDAVAIVIIVTQFLLVSYAARSKITSVHRWVRAHFRIWQVGLAAVAFSVPAAALSADPRAFAMELVLAAALQALNLGTVCLAVSVLDGSEPKELVRRLSTWADRNGARLAWGLGLFVVSICSVLAIVVYQAHPHIPDEVVYLIHARYFAEGMMALPVPPVPGAFEVDLMFADAGRWYSPVPPGWPLVLSVGVMVGLPWLVNPVLAGLCVVLAYHLVAQIYDARTGALTATLMSLSPWYLFIGMSYMTHLAALAFVLVAAVCVVRVQRGSPSWWMWIAGAALGATSLVRPLEGLAAAIVLGIWSLGIRGSRLRWGPSTALTLGAMAVGAIVLPYNRSLTGDWLTFPIMAFSDATFGPGSNSLGFGPERGMGWTGLDPFEGHGAIDVLVNAALNISSINVELFGWAGGSLLLMIALGASGVVTRRDLALLGAAGAVVGLHSFYWFSGGPDFGARYWFLVVVPLVALTARAVLVLGERYHDEGRVMVTVLVMCLVATGTFMPWRSVDKYHGYRGMTSDMDRIAQMLGIESGLVLVRGELWPDYHSAAVYNPVDLDAPVPVYAWDGDPNWREDLARAFPDRPVWIVEGPSLTGDGYRLLDGPIEPGGT